MTTNNQQAAPEGAAAYHDAIDNAIGVLNRLKEQGGDKAFTLIVESEGGSNMTAYASHDFHMQCMTHILSNVPMPQRLLMMLDLSQMVAKER